VTGSSAVPPGLEGGDRKALARRLFTVRALVLDGTLAEVANAFAGKGVRSLLIKGPPLARWLYETPRRRAYLDIDLLVDPEHFEAAEACLQEVGFERQRAGSHPHELYEYHEVWRRDGLLDVGIDLHRRLMIAPAPPELVWECLARDVRTIEVGGATVDVPGPAGLALIVVLHAVINGIGVVKSSEDLRRALERADFPTWREAADLAHELGATEAFAIGLRLLPRGRELADRLGLPTHVSSRRLLLSASSAPDTAAGIEWLVSTPGVGARLRLLLGELVPSREFMRLWFPLSRKHSWGMALAYVWRPLWLAAKLPGGLRAWLRVASRT
jgi:Uncharacterised nucleotidyltransferase